MPELIIQGYLGLTLNFYTWQCTEYFLNKTTSHTQNLIETEKHYPLSIEEEHKHGAVKWATQGDWRNSRLKKQTPRISASLFLNSYKRLFSQKMVLNNLIKDITLFYIKLDAKLSSICKGAESHPLKWPLYSVTFKITSFLCRTGESKRYMSSGSTHMVVSKEFIQMIRPQTVKCTGVGMSGGRIVPAQN